jgi:hypothetical protein
MCSSRHDPSDHAAATRASADVRIAPTAGRAGDVPRHDHGYRIRWRSGRWEFHRPDGTPLPTVGAVLTGNTESLIEMHARARLRIDRTTLTPDWDGERLDPEPILDALLPRRIHTAA